LRTTPWLQPYSDTPSSHFILETPPSPHRRPSLLLVRVSRRRHPSSVGSHARCTVCRSGRARPPCGAPNLAARDTNRLTGPPGMGGSIASGFSTVFFNPRSRFPSLQHSPDWYLYTWILPTMVGASRAIPDLMGGGTDPCVGGGLDQGSCASSSTSSGMQY
jgi:hypothetical protein